MAIEQRCSKRAMLALGNGAACLLVQKGCVLESHTSPLWRRHIVVALLYALVAVDRLREHAVERSTPRIGALISSVDAQVFFNLCMNSNRDQLCLLF